MMYEFFNGLKQSGYYNYVTKAEDNSLFVDDIKVVDFTTLMIFKDSSGCSLDDLYYLISNISIDIHRSK